MTLAAATKHRFRVSGVPVLNYHGLLAPNDRIAHSDRFWVRQSKFCDQLTQVRNCGCDVITLREFVDERYSPNGRSRVVITFDDGRECDYRVAFPLLLEAGVRAEFFLNTASIGRSGYLTWPQIAEMHRAGMSFNSHGHEHLDQSRLSAEELQRQLLISKHEIEDHLASPVEFVAVPYGALHPRTLEVASQLGYRSVCTSTCWPAKASSTFIGRVCIYGDTTAGQLDAILNRSARFFATRALRSLAVRIPKTVVSRLCPQWLESWRDAHA